MYYYYKSLMPILLNIIIITTTYYHYYYDTTNSITMIVLNRLYLPAYTTILISIGYLAVFSLFCMYMCH